MSHLNGVVTKIFIRPSALTGSGDIDTDVTPNTVSNTKMHLSYEAIGMDENGDLVYQLANEDMGVGFQFMTWGDVIIYADTTARGAQDLMTASAREWFEAPEAEVVYITDNKGWI